MKKVIKEKGITLIALVVTIIVLLILASVTLGFAMNGTGLFEKAKLATDQYNNKAQQEEYELEKTTNEISSYIDGNRENIKHNYSTNEQIIGTWINGKTLYQKTIIGNMPTITANGTTVYSYVDIGASVEYGWVEHALLSINGWIGEIEGQATPYSTSGFQTLLDQATLLNNDANFSGARKNSVRLATNCTSHSGEEVTIIVCYTKTTD